MRECIVYGPSGKALCRASVAERFSDRLVGLLRHKELKPSRGLLLRGCKQVHTFGMRFPIDVVFMSNDGEILAVEHTLKPWRISLNVKNAYWALELNSDTVKVMKLNIHDKIKLVFGKEGEVHI